MLHAVSGVFSSKESAQSMVSVGVGINAGITVFSLTFQWAICVMYGGKLVPQYGTPGDAESETKCLPAKKALLVLKGSPLFSDAQIKTFLHIGNLTKLFVLHLLVLQLMNRLKLLLGLCCYH